MPAFADPPSPDAAPRSRWQRGATRAVVLFHRYANWLVCITWKRFVALSLLLVVSALALSSVISDRGDEREEVTVFPAGVPVPPKAPKAPETPKTPEPPGRGDVTISIDKDGVRIASSRASAAPGSPTAPASASSAPSRGASIVGSSDGVEIKLPPGADTEAVREAVEEARSAVVEAIRESEREAIEAAAEAAKQTAESNAKTVRTIRRIRGERNGPQLVGLAWFWVLASAILKITYKGTIQAEVKAAVATETAESEQLKRQVVEARMAAMQAQVEPHFLFNTLASIDHLIETDPPRASQMQKNLIALLRASMPSMRERDPALHDLGREMAVIRPYLEILKVRMEDRLRTRIHVPDGLLSAEFPPMMIQSLVENAIKHGLEPKAEGGELEVAAEIVHGKLAVTVADTGLGFGKAATAGTGVGLENIRERLKLIYGDKAAMVVADQTPTGTVVTLTVPYLAQPRSGPAA